MELIDVFFLAGPLIVVPLGLRLVRVPPILLRLQPAAAILAALSFAFSRGAAATAFAIPWFGLTAALALVGLTRRQEIFSRFGLVYISIGGMWLVISRWGAQPLGFQEPIILLTAVHFHFAGFAVPIIAGRIAQSPFTRALAEAAVTCPPLLALGITCSPEVEVAAASIFSVSLAGLAVAQLRARGILLTISSWSAIAGMILAALYAWSEFSGTAWIDVPTMARWHGPLMAVGFCLCGMAGWLRRATSLKLT